MASEDKHARGLKINLYNRQQYVAYKIHESTKENISRDQFSVRYYLSST